MFEPAYIKALQDGALSAKIRAAREMLTDCVVCPRQCHVNRLEGETGFCDTAEKAVVASFHPHYGEESPLVGSGGSGTIFFSSCNLKCVFCQNYEISHLMEGRETSASELARIMLELQRVGCHNINFVTPSHVAPQLLEALKEAAEHGLALPLVYNTGGYDSVETLKLLDGVVDIYMPDLKFMSSRASELLMNAPDYPEVVTAAIKEMHRQVGDLHINDQGVATRGLLIRHLVMPCDLAETRKAMRFVAQEVSKNTYVNIMSQYRPCGQASAYEEIDRSITTREFEEALRIAEEEGITRLDERAPLRMRFF